MGYEKLIGNPLYGYGLGSTLPIDYNFDHPDYLSKSSIWSTCRDAVEGQAAIKSKGTEYLPQLSGQTDLEYKNYLNRALYYNATGRTVQSYEGMIFRKDPIIRVVDKNGGELSFDTKKYYNRITNTGKSLADLLQYSVAEIIKTNRLGILIDYPDEVDFGSVSAMTKFDKEQAGYKPLLTTYKAETIVNWQFMYVGTTPVPISYVLKEEVYDYASLTSIFPEKTNIYRILALEPYFEESNPSVKVRYKQLTFKEAVIGKGRDEKPVWSVDSIVYPKKNREYLNFIPFYLLTDSGIDFQSMDNPLIYDLAELNISHYRNSADWENELHMVAAKTIYFPGWDKQIYGDPRFGGALAGPKDCIPSVIEASNKSGLSDEMNAKENRMSVLGSEAIDRSGRYVSSSQTAKISAKAEASILTTLSVSLSNAFTEILNFALDWDDKSDLEIKVELNYDFYDEDLSSEQLQSWVKAMQGGAVSFPTYFYNLQRKETYKEGWTMEDELLAIQEGMSNLVDLPEERYQEVIGRIADLVEKLKLTESAGLAGIVAQGVPKGILEEQKNVLLEGEPLVEEKVIEEPIVEVKEE